MSYEKTREPFGSEKAEEKIKFASFRRIRKGLYRARNIADAENGKSEGKS